MKRYFSETSAHVSGQSAKYTCIRHTGCAQCQTTFRVMVLALGSYAKLIPEPKGSRL